MRSAIPRTAHRSTRGLLTAAAAACALLSAGALLSASAASALAAPPRQADTALLGGTAPRPQRLPDGQAHGRAHLRSVAAGHLRRLPAISLADGTTRYDGVRCPYPPARCGRAAEHQGFTAVILLQLEAEGKLSINDPIGTLLPQYPAWRHITIRQLLDMTSRIPDYTSQPAFVAALATNPAARFTTAQLASYVIGVPSPQPATPTPIPTTSSP